MSIPVCYATVYLARLMYSKRQGNQGVALLLVLWMLTLASIMAGSFALTMRRELAIAGNARDLAEASALTEAGIHYAMQMLLTTDRKTRWSANAGTYEIAFASHKIRIKILDESGKISINNPDPKLLRGLLIKAGLEQQQQNQIIDNILDWQDEDDERRTYGAEAMEYKRAGRRYQPANQAFQALEELQLILGMDAALFKQIKPFLTVYSNANKINPFYAEKEVLLALPDVDENLIEHYLQERADSLKKAGPPPDFPYPEIASGNVSGVYTLIAEARLSSGNTGMTKAVITKRNSVKGLPYTILEWHSAPVNEKTLF